MLFDKSICHFGWHDKNEMNSLSVWAAEDNPPWSQQNLCGSTWVVSRLDPDPFVLAIKKKSKEKNLSLEGLQACT